VERCRQGCLKVEASLPSLRSGYRDYACQRIFVLLIVSCLLRLPKNGPTRENLALHPAASCLLATAEVAGPLCGSPLSWLKKGLVPPVEVFGGRRCHRDVCVVGWEGGWGGHVGWEGGWGGHGASVSFCRVANFQS
jgi:hypothetical protein